MEGFVGVYFNSTWGVIPKKWLLKDSKGTKCYWPNKGDVDELAKKGTSPDRREWSSWVAEIACAAG